MCWPFLRSSARAPSIKGGTVAIDAFSTIKRTVRSRYLEARSPYEAIVPLRGDPLPLWASFHCSIVGRRLGAFNCQGSGKSLRIPFKFLGLHFPILFLFGNYLV